jgi:hypothetical protein
MTTMPPPVASPPASVEEIARLEAAAAHPTFDRVIEVRITDVRALLSDRAAMAERVAGLTEIAANATANAVLLRAEVGRLREALEAIVAEWDAAGWTGSHRTIDNARAALTRPDEPTKET